jgi:hypothetical protein
VNQLTGGASDALDGINTTTLQDGATAFSRDQADDIYYRFRQDSVVAPSPPTVVQPVNGPGRWLQQAGVVGPPGPAGPAGPAGPQGPQGDPGPSGVELYSFGDFDSTPIPTAPNSLLGSVPVVFTADDPAWLVTLSILAMPQSDGLISLDLILDFGGTPAVLWSITNWVWEATGDPARRQDYNQRSYISTSAGRLAGAHTMDLVLVSNTSGVLINTNNFNLSLLQIPAP